MGHAHPKLLSTGPPMRQVKNPDAEREEPKRKREDGQSGGKLSHW